MGGDVRALILDPGAGRSALAGCRALGRAGWTVGIGAPSPTIAARTRWARSFHPVPPPHKPGFVEAIVRAGSFDIVLPAGDAEAVALSAARDDIPAVVPYPAHDVVVRSFDKVAVTEIARRCGLRVPEVGDHHTLPVVVKARTHADGRHEATVATTIEELRSAVERLERAGAEPVVQELVRGDLIAVSVVVDRAGRVVARVHQRAARVWPTGAGVSTRAETMPVDPALARVVDAFVQDLGWFGLAQLQFLVPDDGEPRLVDMNGRLYGSLALADAAGVNLPAWWAATALDTEPPATSTAVVGRRYQWLEGDLRRAVAERRGGVVADVAGTFAYAVRARHSIIDLRDPLPALSHAARLVQRAAHKARR